MSTRRLFRSRRQRTVLVVGVALAVVVIGALAIWLLPAALTRHPAVSGPDRYKAIADTRTGVLAFLALLGAAVSAIYAVRTYGLSRTGQITDRFAKAVDQLGEESVDKCIGGIYSLGRIMSDSPADQEAVVEVLSAFVRRRAMRKPDGTVPWPADEADADEVKPSPRIQAALNVLGRRDPDPRVSGHGPDLRDTDLRGARMRQRQFSRASFRRAALYGAHMRDSDFTDATFVRADLRGARLQGAKLAGADFKHAVLTHGALSAEQLAEAENTDGIEWTSEIEPPARTRPTNGSVD